MGAKVRAFCTDFGIERIQGRFKLVSTAITAVIRYGTRHNNIVRSFKEFACIEAACIREADGKPNHQWEATCMHA
jgi:hypothetical protein